MNRTWGLATSLPDLPGRILRPNETAMVEIVLERQVDSTAFRISNDLTPGPIDANPSGKLVE